VLDKRNVIILMLASLLISGMRFSDGSILLAISQGKGIEDPVFSNPLTQYIWDSPLKVLLLKLVSPDIIGIALIFSAIACLPVLGVFTRQKSLPFILAALVVALTPTLKVSAQNIGVGDGLIYALIISAVYTRSNLVVFISLFLTGLWHPQQSFFIGVTYILFGVTFERNNFRGKAVSAISALVIAFITYLAYRYSMGYEYHGRFSYMTSRMDELLSANIRTIPVSFLYLILWAYVAKILRPNVKLPVYIVLWALILAIVSLFTTDVTRVLSIVLLPGLLILLKENYKNDDSSQNSNLVELPLVLVLVNLFIPIVSWSGIDIFLWHDLFTDLCKYNLLCV